MNTRIKTIWEGVNASFWFLPSVMTLGAALLSFVLVSLDQALGDKLSFFYSYSRGPQGARSLLSTVGGSVITVAGVTFSITIAALTLASNQFGPRLLRNFMRDRGNQLVLGTFIATFIYCLLVLRTVNGSQDNSFVPHLSVTFGVLLAVASMGVLIYFIHHVATLMQVETILSSVSDDLFHTMDNLFPGNIGSDPADVDQAQFQETDLPADFDKASEGVVGEDDGYLQGIDTDAVMNLANKYDIICRINKRPGQFIIAGMALAQVWPAQKVDQDFCRLLRKAFIVGPFRTVSQDVEFAVDQLVEIALRALSPGINDPFTAINCIDRIGAALNRLGERDLPSPYRFHEDRKLRVIISPVTKSELVEQSFSQIRQAGKDNVTVLCHMLELINQLILLHNNTEMKRALLKQAALIERAGAKNISDETDLERIAANYNTILKNTSFLT